MKKPIIDPIQFFEEERMAAKPYNSSDEQEVNNARKAAALREKNDEDTLIALAQHENGRKLLFGFTKCIYTGNPFVLDSERATSFNLGQMAQAHGLFMKLIRVAPEYFCTMLEENQDEL